MRDQYVEFDEDYVFLCSPSQMHVFSRTSKAKVISFPPNPTDIYNCASVAFALDVKSDLNLVRRGAMEPGSQRTDVDPPQPWISRPVHRNAVGKGDLKGTVQGDPRWKNVMESGTEGGMTRVRGTDAVQMDFTA